MVELIVLHAVTMAVAHGTLLSAGTAAMDAGMGSQRSSKYDLDVAQSLMVGDIVEGLIIVVGG